MSRTTRISRSLALLAIGAGVLAGAAPATAAPIEYDFGRLTLRVNPSVEAAMGKAGIRLEVDAPATRSGNLIHLPADDTTPATSGDGVRIDPSTGTASAATAGALRFVRGTRTHRWLDVRVGFGTAGELTAREAPFESLRQRMLASVEDRRVSRNGATGASTVSGVDLRLVGVNGANELNSRLDTRFFRVDQELFTATVFGSHSPRLGLSRTGCGARACPHGPRSDGPSRDRPNPQDRSGRRSDGRGSGAGHR